MSSTSGSPSPPPLPPRPSHSRNHSNFSISSSGTSSSSSASRTKPIPFLAARPLKRSATVDQKPSSATSSLGRRGSLTAASASGGRVGPSSSASSRGGASDAGGRAGSRSPTLTRRPSLLTSSVSTNVGNAAISTPRRGGGIASTGSPVPPPVVPRSVTPPVPIPPLVHRRSVSLLTPTKSSSNSTSNSHSPSPIPIASDNLATSSANKSPNRYSLQLASSAHTLPLNLTSSSTSLAGLSFASSSLFARGLGQLPSPPTTASDGANSEGVGRSKSSSGSSQRGRASSGGTAAVETPKRRSTISTGDVVVPIIERESPSVVGGSPRSPERGGTTSVSSSRKTERVLKAGESTSESDAVTVRGEDEEEEERQKLRAEEEEKRKRRTKRAAEVREKNQRILDSINSNTNHQPSPPSSTGSSSPRRRPLTLHRASTNHLPLHLSTTSESSSLETSLTPSAPSPSPSTPLPFSPAAGSGMILDGSEGRLSTSASTSSFSSTRIKSDRERERERRIRTLGLTSLTPTPPNRERERPGSVASGHWRSSTEVDEGGYERPQTAAGDNRDRDSFITGSMRRLGSGESGGSMRRRRRLSDIGSGRGGGGGLSETGNTTSSVRARPGLPQEFVGSPKEERVSEWREEWRNEESRRTPVQGSEMDDEREQRTDVFQNGLRKLDQGQRSASSTGQRYSDIAAELQQRKDRLRSTDVGSEAWIAEVNELRIKAKSRASGSSGGDSHRREGSLQTPVDRDRTLRSLTSATQGLSLNPSETSSDDIPQSAPGRLSSTSYYQTQADTSTRRRKSSGGFTSTTYSSPPPSASLSRADSATSTSRGSGAESSRSVHFGAGGNSIPTAEHHQLLHQAFDQFDSHFVPPEGRDSLAPESVDLVKRMSAMVQATTKLNMGLRALSNVTVEAQIESQLDERSPGNGIGNGLGQFEKHVNSLVRSSDDQIRSLTEGLIAFIRTERERDKLRRESSDGGAAAGMRPPSRASSVRLHTSPKRPATSSPFHEASVSISSSRALIPRQLSLRDPMEEPDNTPSSSSSRRTTQSFSGSRGSRSPYAGYESPTPASPSVRRDVAFMRSPLSAQALENSRPGTPSRGYSTSSTKGLPLPPSSLESSSSIRRSKSSANSNATVRPTTPAPPSSIRFPGAPSTTAALVLDPTPAITGTSPTQTRLPRSAHGMRTFSEADRPEFEHSLGTGRTSDRDRDAWRHTMSASSASNYSLSRGGSGEEEDDIHSLQSSSAGRPPRQRLSTGSIGGMSQALRNGLSTLVGTGRMRRNTNESTLPSPSMFEGSSSASPEERRRERRKEVENILRRTTARSSLG